MKKVLAILLAAVMLLSLTATAANAEGEPASKITEKLANKIAEAAQDEKLPVAVTADLSVSAEVREGFELRAAEQAGVELEEYDNYINNYNGDPGGISQEEKEQRDEYRARWQNFESTLYSLLKDVRIEKINAVLDASGADIDAMDGGYYTTGCLLLPKRIMLTAAQINALAELDLVTSLDVSTYRDPVSAQKDMSKIITEELAARLDEVGEDERVSVCIQYGIYNSPYRLVGNDNSYEPADQIIRETYGYKTANVNRVTEFELWRKRNSARTLIKTDFYQNYSSPLRLKTLALNEDDTYVYDENGTPNIELLNLTKSKLYEIIQNDNVTSVSLVDPYGNPPVPDEPEAGYFIVGTMTNWELDPGYNLKYYESNNGSYFFEILMTPDDAFKIVYSPDGLTLDNAEYFPAGRGNAFNQENPIILKTNFYSFEFRPDCDGGITYSSIYGPRYSPQEWYYNCLFCIGYDPWVVNASAKLPNPDPEHNDPEPGYYVVGTMTDWELNKNYKFPDSQTQPGFTVATLDHGFTLRMNDKFKIAYSEDGVNITRWYPEGEGNAYNEDKHRIDNDEHYFHLYFTPYGNASALSYLDSHGDPHYGMISILYYELPTSLTLLPIPAEGELFKAKLKNDYSLSDSDFSEYEELCYHKDKDGITDWVLLKAKSAETEDQTYCDLIGNRAYIQDKQSTPFESSYAVYDAAKKEFIPLTGEIVAQYKDLGRIFDKVGEGRLIGDVDNDDELSAIDCTFIQRFATRIGNWPENDEIQNAELRSKLNMSYYSDFDRDGERDIVDATRLQRYVTAAG